MQRQYLSKKNELIGDRFRLRNFFKPIKSIFTQIMPWHTVFLSISQVATAFRHVTPRGDDSSRPPAVAVKLALKLEAKLTLKLKAKLAKTERKTCTKSDRKFRTKSGSKSGSKVICIYQKVAVQDALKVAVEFACSKSSTKSTLLGSKSNTKRRNKVCIYKRWHSKWQ